MKLLVALSNNVDNVEGLWALLRQARAPDFEKVELGNDFDYENALGVPKLRHALSSLKTPRHVHDRLFDQAVKDLESSNPKEAKSGSRILVGLAKNHHISNQLLHRLLNLSTEHPIHDIGNAQVSLLKHLAANSAVSIDQAARMLLLSTESSNGASQKYVWSHIKHLLSSPAVVLELVGLLVSGIRPVSQLVAGIVPILQQGGDTLSANALAIRAIHGSPALTQALVEMIRQKMLPEETLLLAIQSSNLDVVREVLNSSVLPGPALTMLFNRLTPKQTRALLVGASVLVRQALTKAYMGQRVPEVVQDFLALGKK